MDIDPTSRLTKDWTDFANNSLPNTHMQAMFHETDDWIMVVKTGVPRAVNGVAQEVLQFLESKDADKLAWTLANREVVEKDKKSLTFERHLTSLKNALAERAKKAGSSPDIAKASAKMEELLKQVADFKAHPEKLRPELPNEIFWQV